MEAQESFSCRCERGDLVLRKSHKTHNFDRLSCPRSKDPSEVALSLGNTECSNCKLLTMKINILEARLAMERHPEDHACQSAAILHELLNEMENLCVE
ncbi:hypothetical protein Tco_0674459 [Tanacetum coccineum]